MRMNSLDLSELVKVAGGQSQAIVLIMQELGCSSSKAEKLAGGRYPSKVSRSEAEKLAALTKKYVRGPTLSRQRDGRTAS